MPQGLQAWDANGNIVVDLGDYSTRFITSVVIFVPSGQSAASVGVAGLSNLNCFAVIVNSDEAAIDGIFLTEFTSSIVNGGVWATSIVGPRSYGRTVYIDVYAYSG